jgi:amino acid transporter
MDYRTGKMKSLYTRLKNLIDRYDVPALIAIIASILFLIIWYFLLTSSSDERFSTLTSLIIGGFIAIYLTIWLIRIESRIKIDKLKPYILSELEFILISLIINFARLYVIYFEVLKLYDFTRLFQIIEKRKENITNCLLFKEIYSLRNKLNDFHYILETDKEIKPIIKPLHMTLFISVLTSLTSSTFNRDFIKNMLHIWYEINELNKEIEVLEGLSWAESVLIHSISQRIEKIAIKIDEILEKEGTNL